MGIEDVIGESVEEPEPEYLLDPGDIIFEMSAMPDALWGEGYDVLATRGEATMIYSGTGIGKTTLAQQLGLKAIGIGKPELLGMAVNSIEGKVLYIAADRPSQALRSLRRMVTEDDREALKKRWLWERKRMIRIALKNPRALMEFCREHHVGLLIIDSLKDVLTAPTSDESGQAFNDAIQLCVVAGIEVVVLHHPRKAPADGRVALTLDDVYGSTWITAGLGSVIALNGEAGSGVAKLQHLKFPAEEVGPFDVAFDYDTGTATAFGMWLIQEILDGGGVYEITEIGHRILSRSPTDRERERLRRMLERLVKKGSVERSESEKGKPVRYWAKGAWRES